MRLVAWRLVATVVGTVFCVWIAHRTYESVKVETAAGIGPTQGVDAAVFAILVVAVGAVTRVAWSFSRTLRGYMRRRLDRDTDLLPRRNARFESEKLSATRRDAA
jgi:hypothetical protein